MAALGSGRAAQTAKRSSQFAAACAAIAQRRGKKIAAIAIAGELLTRACDLLASAQSADTNTAGGAATTAVKTGASPSPGHARGPGAACCSRGAAVAAPRPE